MMQKVHDYHILQSNSYKLTFILPNVCCIQFVIIRDARTDGRTVLCDPSNAVFFSKVGEGSKNRTILFV